MDSFPFFACHVPAAGRRAFHPVVRGAQSEQVARNARWGALDVAGDLRDQPAAVAQL